MFRKACVAGLMGLAFVAAPTSAQAQVDNLIGGTFGGFLLRGEDGRADDDVLNQRLTYLAFDISDFNGVIFGGEYLVGIGDWIEAGVGVSYYQRTVPSVYLEYTDADGSEIEQDTKFRNVPVTASVRFFPIGRSTPIQPYVGGGVNFYRWRFSESGEFLDFSAPFPCGGDVCYPTFRGTFTDDGNSTGPVFIGGVRAPVTPNFLIGGEFRWQGGTADLDPDVNFGTNTLDLGGYVVQATFHVKF